jgi:WD40 repeat protein
MFNHLETIEKAGSDTAQFFLPKGGWGERAGELTWGFVGREAEREQIAQWLASGRGGLLAVTGDPGAGKSALLGDVVMRANRSVRDALIRAKLAQESRWDWVFEKGGWSAAVDLVGLTAKEAAERLGAEAFGAEWAEPVSPPAGLAVDSVGRLLAMAEGKRSGPGLAFLVDGLDEAVEPWRLASDLLVPLAALEGVSVLVGTRRSVDSRLGSTRPEDDGLLRVLGGHSPVEVRRDPNAMSAYLEAMITDRVKVPPGLAAETARAVSAVEGQPFLYARLAAFELESAVDPALFAESITADGPAATLGPGCAEVFAKALERIKAANPANKAILQALALAQGRGIPEKDGVWTSAAQSLAPAGIGVTAAETRALFDSRARAYITGYRDFGQTVYRFADRAFQEAVLDDLRAEAPDPALAEAAAHAKVAAALTDAAWRTLTSAEGRTILNPYIAHRLPAHCALAGGDPWALVEARAPILDHLDPTSVALAVFTGGFGAATVQPQVAAVAANEHLMASLGSHLDREFTRELQARRFGAEPRPARPDTGGENSPHPRVAWASLTPSTFHRRLDVGGGVWAMTAINPSGSRELLALGFLDGTVQLWDPATGQPEGQPMEPMEDEASALALAAVQIGDRVLLARGTYDGPLRLWDLATGQPQGRPMEGHTGSVDALAAVRIGDRVLLASGGEDGTVRLWDPATGQPQGEPMEDHQGEPMEERRAVTALAAVRIGDRVLLASGGDDGTVRLLDPATGQPEGQPVRGDESWVNALAAVQVGDRVLLATGGHEGTVRLWDPATGQPQGRPLEGHTDSVYALAAVRIGGRVVLASGSVDGTVRLWDPAAERPQGEPTEVRNGLARAFVAVRIGDRVVLASGGFDGTVRLWDPATGRPQGRPMECDTGLDALAEVRIGDRVLLASGGFDGTVRLWDPATGRPRGRPMKGHKVWVSALAAVRIGNRVLLASGGDDGTVRLRNPASIWPRGWLMKGHEGWVRALAVAQIGGRVLLASGGDDGTVRLWDPATRRPQGRPLEGHTDSVYALAAVRIGDRVVLASGSFDGTVRLWDPATGRPQGEPTEVREALGSALAAVQIGDRVLLASGSYDGTVRLWDPATAEPASSHLINVGDEVTGLVALGRGRLAVGMSMGLAVLEFADR